MKKLIEKILAAIKGGKYSADVRYDANLDLYIDKLGRLSCDIECTTLYISYTYTGDEKDMPEFSEDENGFECSDEGLEKNKTIINALMDLSTKSKLYDTWEPGIIDALPASYEYLRAEMCRWLGRREVVWESRGFSNSGILRVVKKEDIKPGDKVIDDPEDELALVLLPDYYMRERGVSCERVHIEVAE